ncbi:MAG: MerR family transcriptional regulator [Chloroflexota bacterium]
MFDTGKFSRMARVSKRTLRYYDSIDLFKPLKVDPETGTRYYSAEQFADLNRILSLKELGMTLEQIRRMLADDVSSEEIYGMLLLKKAEAEQKLLEDIKRLRGIEARLQSPDVYVTQGVVLKSVPERPFLSYRSTLNGEQMFPLYQSIIRRVPRLAGRKNLSYFTTLMHWDEFDMENMDAELGYYLAKPSASPVGLSEDVFLTERTLPAVAEMASVILVGGPERYPAGFEAVTRWCEQNGYDINKPERYIFLEMPADGNPDETVIELQFPVERVVSDPKSLLSLTK